MTLPIRSSSTLKLCQLPSKDKLAAFRRALNDILGGEFEVRPTVGMTGAQVKLLPLLRARVQEAVKLGIIRTESLSQLKILIQGDGSSFTKTKGMVMIGIKILNLDSRVLHQVQNFHPVMLLDGSAHIAAACDVSCCTITVAVCFCLSLCIGTKSMSCWSLP